MESRLEEIINILNTGELTMPEAKELINGYVKGLNEKKSKTLGKIATEKVKAYENPNNVNYNNDTCYVCDDKYLYPSDHDNIGKCPSCVDLDICYNCEGEFKEKELIEDRDGEYKCKECHQPLCGSCNEEVDLHGDYCCKECYELQFE